MTEPDMTWMLVSDENERRRKIAEAVERVFAQRSAAENRRIPLQMTTDGNVWRLGSEDADVALAWMLKDNDRVVLADILLLDTSPLGGSTLWTQLRRLAREQHWTGSLNFSEIGNDPIMAGLAVAASATRVATKMQLDVANAVSPERIALVAMTTGEYVEYRSTANHLYASELLESGAVADLAEATQQADQQMTALLPDGLNTAGHRIWTIQHDGTRVGTLWVFFDDARAFIYNIDMEKTARGQGYGTQALRAAAAETRAARLPTLALNVFGHNDGARRLYEREGFAVTEVLWSAPLS